MAGSARPTFKAGRISRVRKAADHFSTRGAALARVRSADPTRIVQGHLERHHRCLRRNLPISRRLEAHRRRPITDLAGAGRRSPVGDGADDCRHFVHQFIHLARGFGEGNVLDSIPALEFEGERRCESAIRRPTPRSLQSRAPVVPVSFTV